MTTPPYPFIQLTGQHNPLYTNTTDIVGISPLPKGDSNLSDMEHDGSCIDFEGENVYQWVYEPPVEVLALIADMNHRENRRTLAGCVLSDVMSEAKEGHTADNMANVSLKVADAMLDRLEAAP